MHALRASRVQALLWSRLHPLGQLTRVLQGTGVPQSTKEHCMQVTAQSVAGHKQASKQAGSLLITTVLSAGHQPCL